jgi:hypothetical protein
MPRATATRRNYCDTWTSSQADLRVFRTSGIEAVGRRYSGPPAQGYRTAPPCASSWASNSAKLRLTGGAHREATASPSPVVAHHDRGVRFLGRTRHPAARPGLTSRATQVHPGQPLPSRLAVRHGTGQQQPVVLPLTEASDEPLHIEGIAAAGNVDSTRQMFSRCAFRIPFLKSRMPKLLYRHDPQQIAGQIDELYHAEGNLCIRAFASHELARRCPALSVAATVLGYEIRNADSKNFYAEILDAEIAEVSLTPSPANAHALVMRRYPVPASVKVFDLTAQAVGKMQEIVAALRASCLHIAAFPVVGEGLPARLYLRVAPNVDDAGGGGEYRHATDEAK